MLVLVFDRFTDEARQVVVAAQQEARDLRHSQIDTEHQLLGVLADRRNGAGRVLKGFGVTPKRARAQVVRIVGRGEVPVEGFMPFTPAAKKVLELSLRESLSYGSQMVTAEHFLRGVLREEDGVAVQVLRDLGADPRDITEALLPLLPVANPAGPIPRAFAPRPVFVRSDPVMGRLLEACIEQAIDDDRSEFGIGDLLAAIVEDEEAAAIVSSLGLDLQSLLQLEEPEAFGDPAG